VSIREHKGHAPSAQAVRIAVITVSDSRTEATDEGGPLVRKLCAAAGFQVASTVIMPDEPAQVRAHVRALVEGDAVEAVLLTGGTGISQRDSTVEAVTSLFEKTLDGFGEIFRYLSYQEVGPAAMLSRATAGTLGRVVVFAMPGSPAGVRLALEKLILPELAHIVAQLGGVPAGHRSPAPHHRHAEHDQHHHAKPRR
jgi:molybdopterin adenylyltransferase